MPEAGSLVSRKPGDSPPWRQEGVQRKRPSNERQSGLGKQQGDDKKRGAHTPACVLGRLSVEAWLGSGGPLQRARGGWGLLGMTLATHH